MYIRPPENYDFTSSLSYKKLHSQSSNPPVGLPKIVEKTHDYLDFVYDNETILTRFFPHYDSKEFESIESVIEFIIETGDSSYFFINSINGCSDGRTV